MEKISGGAWLLIGIIFIIAILLFVFDSWKTGWIPVVLIPAIIYIFINQDRINQG